MTILEMDSEVCNLRAEEERILASFTRRLIEIATVSGAHETASSPIAALNAMRLPAIAIDQHGVGGLLWPGNQPLCLFRAFLRRSLY